MHTQAPSTNESPQTRSYLAQSLVVLCWACVLMDRLCRKPTLQGGGCRVDQGNQKLSGTRQQVEEGSKLMMDCGPFEHLMKVGAFLRKNTHICLVLHLGAEPTG